MSSKTRSEKMFEEFCQSNSLVLKPLPIKPDEEKKTPDYELDLDDLTVIVEVKQIDFSPDDKAHLRNLEEKGDTGFLASEPGARVRKKIKGAMPQLKAKAAGKHPAMLVLYDNVQLLDDIAEYEIRTGMYGLEHVDIAVPQDPTIKPQVLRHRFGKKQSVSRAHNTTLSCLAVLRTDKEERITLDIYHNDYPAVPLDPNSFHLPTVRHYRLEPTITQGVFRRWIEI